MPARRVCRTRTRHPVKPLNIIALGLMVVLGILVSAGRYLALTEDVEPAEPISIRWYHLDRETFNGVGTDLSARGRATAPGSGRRATRPLSGMSR